MKRDKFVSLLGIGVVSTILVPSSLGARTLTRTQKLIRDSAHKIGQPWGLTIAAICKTETSYGLDMNHSEDSYGWYALSGAVLSDYASADSNNDFSVYLAISDFFRASEIALWHWERCYKWAGELGFKDSYRWYVANRIWNGGKKGWKKSITKRHADRINIEVKQLRKEGFV